MKRDFNYFINNNIPDYIIKLADAIKNEKDITIILPKDVGDDIDSTDYIIDYLVLIMDNKFKEIYNAKNNIEFIYRYYSIEFKILLQYNENKKIYRIICNIQ